MSSSGKPSPCSYDGFLMKVFLLYLLNADFLIFSYVISCNDLPVINEKVSFLTIPSSFRVKTWLRYKALDLWDWFICALFVVYSLSLNCFILLISRLNDCLKFYVYNVLSLILNFLFEFGYKFTNVRVLQSFIEIVSLSIRFWSAVFPLLFIL